VSWFTGDDLLVLEEREVLDDITKLARELRGLRQFVERVYTIQHRDPQKPYIMAAAWRDADGVIHSLPPPARHGDIARLLPKSAGRLYSGDDGFLTNWGVFVDRKEAHKIATAANQIIRRCGGDTRNLFTENLF
jgi:hypothetical protein